MITILGPTATGKTHLAAQVACRLNGEVISADSRQVYRGMNLGTGKDYDDYLVDGKRIPYHLIDIADPGYEYNVFEYQQDFANAYKDICERGKLPVLCGGTGMYLEAVIHGYNLQRVPENNALRLELEGKSKEELIDLLHSFKSVHNISDISNRSRLIRAIEIQTQMLHHQELINPMPETDPVIFGIYFDRLNIRERITLRLVKRLEMGMVEEVKNMLATGLHPDKIIFYGLEYKFLTWYVLGEINYEQMFRLLNTAIHQFAKRQMTWFRRMEKQGIRITWIDGSLSNEEKLQIILKKMNKNV